MGFQHNMHIQPRLVPGQNQLWVEAAQLDNGSKVQAEWIYQVDGEEKRSLRRPGQGRQGGRGGEDRRELPVEDLDDGGEAELPVAAMLGNARPRKG